MANNTVTGCVINTSSIPEIESLANALIANAEAVKALAKAIQKKSAPNNSYGVYIGNE